MMARRRKRTNRRGSVILMVVGILTALAMMGTAFLLVTFVDREDAAAVNDAAPIRMVVEGLAQRVRIELLDDLRIGAAGPYTDLAGVVEANVWKVGIDYASPDPAYGFDRHLASLVVFPRGKTALPGQPQASVWPKLSDPKCFNPELEDDPDYRNLTVTGVSAGDNRLVDTDGDGVRDAFLFPTGTFSSGGTQYWAAVRVIDLSGLVNINAAYKSDRSQAWMNVGMISPYRLPQAWSNDAYHPTPAALPFPSSLVLDARNSEAYGRSGGGGFFDKYVRRMDYPSPAKRPYAAFDWSDELACRWMDTIEWNGGNVSYNQAPKTRDCRLSRLIACGGVDRWTWGQAREWAVYGRLLTTYSAGRSLARYTGSVQDANWKMPTREKVDLNLLTIKNDPVLAFDVYRRAFYQILPHLDEDQRKLEAAQLAVNLIDFLDADRKGDDRATVAVEPDSKTKVMGIERQPFLTQAWYRVVAKAKGDGDTGGGTVPDLEITPYMALVLYNPYNDPIKMTNWKIKVGAQSDTFSGTIPGKGRFVLYNSKDIKIDGKAARVDTPITILNDPGKEIMIYRPGYSLAGAASDDVPVARFSPGLFDPEYVAPATDGAVVTAHVSRDEDQDALRMAVARYGKVANPTDYTTTSGIGKKVSPASASFGEIKPTPVFVRGYDGTAGRMWNVAELCRIFRIGPTATQPLDERLADELGQATTDIARLAIGRLHTFRFAKSLDPRVPYLPALVLASDYFTVDSPTLDGIDNDGDGKKDGAAAADWHAWNRETVEYGRININTAPIDVLCTLPLLAPGNDKATEDKESVDCSADFVMYRDKDLVGGLTSIVPFFAGRVRMLAMMGATGSNFRDDTRGIASPGELGLVAGYRSHWPALKQAWAPSNDYTTTAYAEGVGGTDDGYSKNDVANDLSKYEMRYAYLSNCIRTNSDTYCAYIRVQLGDSVDATIKRNYIAIIDRSNCVVGTDIPVLRAFAEIK